MGGPGRAADAAEATVARLARSSGSVALQHSALEAQGHRPWPLPDRRWLMAQTWCDLLFAHWPVPPKAVEALLPRPLALDRHEDRAWIGVTPFVVRGFRLRGTPPPPALGSFPEINVRTYVLGDAGRPGIFFFSLDTTSLVSVVGARRSHRLPYFRAR